MRKQLILFKDEQYKLINQVQSFGDYQTQADKESLKSIVSQMIDQLITIGKEYGFKGNLWSCYLTHLLINHENSLTLALEKSQGIGESLKRIGLYDLEILFYAYRIEWKDIEEMTDIPISQFIEMNEPLVSRSIKYSKTILKAFYQLNENLENALNAEEMFEHLARFYGQFGVGRYGLHKAFKIRANDEKINVVPILKTDEVHLDDLVGYDIQKKKLIKNTEAFVKGRKANNVLLYGDSGTGKSTSIKAVLNQYYDDGLRMIEVYKHQFIHIPEIIAEIKNRNYKFIIYMDDLSFEEFEIEYKYLKAVIEGGLESKPDNLLIYATSNRRHLIKETWDERKQCVDDVHGGDTMQEKQSLVTRFGETIYYGAPEQKEYIHIVQTLATKYNIHMDEQQLRLQAIQWEMQHGGLSGRSAQQFINHVLGTMKD